MNINSYTPNNKNNQAQIYIPQDFDILKVLPKYLHKHKDYAEYLIHLIYWKSIQQFGEKGKWVNLKYEYLRKVINYKVLSPLLRILKRKNIIICDEHYIQGIKAKSYSLNPILLDKPFKLIPLTNKIIMKKKQHIELNPLQEELFNDLHKITLSNEETLPTEVYNEEIAKIQAIKDKQFYLKPDLYGRVHTNLTNINKKIRKLLMVNNKPLKELDIANSQPLVFINLLKSLLVNTQNTHPPTPTIMSPLFSGLKNWGLLAENGHIYDFLMFKYFEKYGKTITREEAKSKLYKWWFAPNYQRQSNMEKVIEEQFPEIYKLTKELKQTDYCRLAHEMQRMESKLVFGAVKLIKSIHPERFIATIHDSFLIEEEYAEETKELITTHFRTYGLNPIIRGK